MAKTGRRGRPRSADTDDLLLATTMSLLREVGYHGLTIEAVAARAGVGRPTVYRRWTNKDHLVVAALAAAVSHEDAPATGDPIENLRLRVVSLSRHLHQTGLGPIILGVYAAAQSNPDLAEALREGYLEPGTQWLASTVEQAIARKRLPADVDIELVRNLLFGPALYHLVLAGEPATDRLATAMFTAAIQGLRRT